MARRDWSTSNFLRYASGVATAAPLTMACWAKTSITGSASAQAIMGLYTSTAGANLHCFELAVRQTTDLLLARVGDASVSTGAPAQSSAITANTWFHACGVFTSSTSRAAFLNGTGKGTNTTARTPVGINRTSVGVNDSAAAAIPFAPAGTGDIAEAAIWNVALSDADVASLALGIHPFLVRPDALVAYWPILGSYSPEINLKSNTSVQTMQGTLTRSAHPRIFMPSNPRGRRFTTAVAAAITYPRLERGIRGLNRGMMTGSFH